MKIKFNKEMDNFWSKYFGEKKAYQKKFGGYIEKIIHEQNIKINSRYKLRTGKVSSGKRIWYTNDFGFRYRMFWKRTVNYVDNIDLMKYELDGNELYFEYQEDIKECFKNALRVYLQILYQMRKQKVHFVTFLQFVETENENGNCRWSIQIRFYTDRERKKGADTIWGNIEEFANPVIWIYI